MQEICVALPLHLVSLPVILILSLEVNQCRYSLEPGNFVLEKSQLYADMETGELLAAVLRQNGSDGTAKVQYTTM